MLLYYSRYFYFSQPLYLGAELGSGSVFLIRWAVVGVLYKIGNM
jgi:hypothetical protein